MAEVKVISRLNHSTPVCETHVENVRGRGQMSVKPLDQANLSLEQVS